MEKIPSLFQRERDGDRNCYDEVTTGCEWVISGVGRATRKWDGSACMVRDGILYKRYTHRKGKPVPPGFIPVTDEDPNTGKTFGWIEVDPYAKEDKYYREGFENWKNEGSVKNGTYELVGPKVQGNPEGFTKHTLLPHGCLILEGVPRTFEGLREWFRGKDLEGIVFWDDEGNRKSKVKKSDFGMSRQD